MGANERQSAMITSTSVWSLFEESENEETPDFIGLNLPVNNS
jgi:hypothetical protein